MTRSDALALVKAIEADLAAARYHRQQALDFVTRLEQPGAATVVAASLHHHYGAIEVLVERTMRAFGHAIPSGPRRHAELLELANQSRLDPDPNRHAASLPRSLVRRTTSAPPRSLVRSLPDECLPVHATLVSLDIEGTRPALFGAASRDALVELLSFRHFFRHAYAVAWDPERLRRNCEVMARAQAEIDDDVSRFVSIVRAAASAAP